MSHEQTVNEDATMANVSVLPSLWRSLQDTTWTLHRTLRSTNTAEPSGTCTGKVTFTSRPPSTFVDKDGKLQAASREMLYTETGDFQMSNSLPNSPSFSFSRKYVWRLRDHAAQAPEISIWFTKPGTEEIDYLFHAFLVQRIEEGERGGDGVTSVRVDCSGGHLCVEDYYSSTYTFSVERSGNGAEVEFKVESWIMYHDVRGPKKDQSIETLFLRDKDTAD